MSKKSSILLNPLVDIVLTWVELRTPRRSDHVRLFSHWGGTLGHQRQLLTWNVELFDCFANDLLTEPITICDCSIPSVDSNIVSCFQNFECRLSSRTHGAIVEESNDIAPIIGQDTNKPEEPSLTYSTSVDSKDLWSETGNVVLAMKVTGEGSKPM